MSAAAKEALLGHHFLTGLPMAMWLKLLEHHPTPTLPEMVSFCKQVVAICLVGGDSPSPLLCATATTASSESTSNVAMPFSASQDLTMAVKDLQIQQKVVVAALSTNSQLSHSSSQDPLGVPCVFSKELGHIAINCPFKVHSPPTKSTGPPAGFAHTPQ